MSCPKSVPQLAPATVAPMPQFTQMFSDPEDKALAIEIVQLVNKYQRIEPGKLKTYLSKKNPLYHFRFPVVLLNLLDREIGMSLDRHLVSLPYKNTGEEGIEIERAEEIAAAESWDTVTNQTLLEKKNQGASFNDLCK